MKRKGFVFILVLAIIAVVLTIVFINLFKDKETKELASSVNAYVEDGYLNDESDEYQTITEYLQDIYVRVSSSEEKAEISNYINSYYSFVVSGEFFNRQIVFSKFTDTYKNNRKAIQSSLKKAQSSANKMMEYIDENREVAGGSDYWLANTWTNSKGYMADLFNFTVDAINRLGDVYESSVTSKVVNNNLTTLIFDTIDTLSKETKEKLTTDASCGTTLNTFVSSYLTKENESKILSFNYDSRAKENVKTITEKALGWEFIYNSFLLGNIV